MKCLVPIPKQLLNWGFVDIIKARQKKLGAQSTDFIFDRAKDLSDDPSKKFMDPWLHFIRDKLGIIEHEGTKYSFHSFRDTVSVYTEKLGIGDSMVNKIMGWEGKTTRQKSYLKHQIDEIKTEADKIEYPEEILHLEEWKKIIPDLYINPEHISHKRGKYKPHININ